MTYISAPAEATDEVTRLARPGTVLIIALVIGLLAASAGAFLTLRAGQPASTGIGSSAALADAASRQYADWFLRPSTTGRQTTSASEQYADWFLRPSTRAGASTTASRQYLDWFTRPSLTLAAPVE